jgi:hypothetical protein
MELVALFAIIVFSIVGLMITVAIRSATREAGIVGQNLIAESQRAREEFDQAVRNTYAAMKPPDQIVITEQFEPASSGRQLTEHELREIIYSGVGMVLDKKLDPADLAVKLSAEMKRSLDIRVKQP